MKNKNIALVAVLFITSVFITFAENGPTPKVVVGSSGISDGSVTNDKLAEPVSVANGGTGATTAATARTNLGVAYGAAAGTVCQGNDSRLSDARTPTAHGHSGEEVTSGTVADARIASTLARDSEVTSAVSTHAALTGTHGVTTIAGLAETQTLTNKTLDSTNSVVGEAVKSGTVADARIASTICRDSELTTHAGATATHGVSGTIVGTSDTQTLTNKTLDSTNSVTGDAIKTGTVADARIDAAICRDSELTTHGNLTAAHGATGAVVGTTNTQTVTNKTMGSGCAWGGTAIPVANGGTGKTTAAEALAALGGASLNGSSTVDFNIKNIYGAASSNSAPTYSFSGDTNTGIYSNSPDLLGLAAGGVTGLVTSGGNTAMGANVTSTYKLRLIGTGSNTVALSAELVPDAVTTTGAQYLVGIHGATTKHNISETATNTSYLRGLTLDSFISDGNFQGGLTNQFGAYIRTGINVGTGTITNSYGLYLGLLRTTGTIVNAWGLYQDAPTARNYFAGNVLVGTTTDDGVNKLQVNGSMRLVGGAAPGSPTEGSVYFNSTDKHFYGYNGTGWVQLDN